MPRKNPNEPKLDIVKLTPKIKLSNNHGQLIPKLHKNDPFIRRVKNDTAR
jgi:hypothetical protein